MLILDISCQHLGDECKLEGFCVPFGHRVGGCTFLEMYICIGYMLPTFWGVYVSWIYMLISDISFQTRLKMMKNHRVRECTFLKMYICIGYVLKTFWGIYVSWIYVLVLDISCQHLGDKCNLECLCVPFGHRVGECTFLEIYICIGYMLPTIWGIYVSWIYVLVLDVSCQHLGDKCKLVVKNQVKL